MPSILRYEIVTFDLAGVCLDNSRILMFKLIHCFLTLLPVNARLLIDGDG